MKQPGSYSQTKAPFIALLVLILLLTVYNSIAIWLVSKLDYFPAKQVNRLLTESGILLLMLSGECFIYWMIRARIFNKNWAGLHITALFIAFFLMPLFYSFLLNIYAAKINQEEYATIMAAANAIRKIIHWMLFLIGHIFFVLLMIKAFQARKKAVVQQGLLDEFAAE